ATGRSPGAAKAAPSSSMLPADTVAGDVAARVRDAVHQPLRNRVDGAGKDDKTTCDKSPMPLGEGQRRAAHRTAGGKKPDGRHRGGRGIGRPATGGERSADEPDELPAPYC